MSKRKQILTDFLDQIWSRGEADAVEVFLADAYTIHNDPGDPWEGRTLDRAGFRERLVQSRALAPDQRFTPVEMIEEGDRIAVAWRWEGTHRGDMPGLPATGASIAMTGMTVYYFDGDRLSGHWQVADRLGVYRQMMAAQQGGGDS